MCEHVGIMRVRQKIILTIKGKWKTYLYIYYNFFYFCYYYFVTIMLISVLTLLLGSLTISAPVWCSDAPPFTDTVTPLRQTALKKEAGSTIKKHSHPHFTCTKILILICQKVGKRKSIDDIVRKSR